MTYRAKFVKDGKYLYDAVMFGGNVGVYTGMKAGAFSVSQNQRNTHNDVALFENIAMMFLGYNEISWIIRTTLNECDTYECAHKKMRDD